MNLSLSLSKKLKRLLNGEQLPFSQLKNPVVNTMIDDGIIGIKTMGRSRKKLFIPNPEKFITYLKNQLGINDLDAYIELLETESTRTESVLKASDSKIKKTRTFKGFLITSIFPVKATLNKKPIVVQPVEGSCLFISDYETFSIPEEVTVVGIENSENFRYIRQQAHLFPDPNTLFVSRYPQSRDLIRWLQTIDNPYLHFGDYDFAGICIFLNEFYQHLPKRAKLFIPDNLDNLIAEYGNRKLYEYQYHLAHGTTKIKTVNDLTTCLHKHGKCLEQEVFIRLE